MVSLADLLKAKKEASLQPTDVEPEIDYLSKGIAAVGEECFLATYKVLICHPYDVSIMDFRSYRDFVLGDAQYALNTFYQLNIERLLRLYLIHHPIKEPKHLHSLSSSLWELELCVPGSYQLQIEALIIHSSKRKNFLIDKLPDFG